ncbi:MAG: hypothetical protein JOZ78_24295 [Chroococcidiopsidaceae cyanobacterium CP_BM_ER_R8_30]|nr:hypothetical protein [Chroococcidiopsidaceae cyanobacterium CP_BM_ER_R8_30]
MSSLRAVVVDPSVSGRLVLTEVDSPSPTPSEALVRSEKIGQPISRWSSASSD